MELLNNDYSEKAHSVKMHISDEDGLQEVLKLIEKIGRNKLYP